MPNSELELTKPPRSFFYRVIRAVVIGFILYYLLGFLYMCAHIDTKKIGQTLEARHNQQIANEYNNFRPWTGKAPEHYSVKLVQAGTDWANKYNVLNYPACRTAFPGDHKVYERQGCFDRIHKIMVVDKLKDMPTITSRNWGDGTTTEECSRLLGARDKVVVDDLIARGEANQVRYYFRSYPGPVAPEECANFDNVRVGRVVNEPIGRVYDWKRNVGHGAKFTEQDKQQLAKDYQGVLAFPENKNKDIYLAEVESLFQMVGGKDYVLGTPGAFKLADNPGLRKIQVSCEQYQQQIHIFKETDKSISDQERALDRKQDESGWQTLNQQRVSNMNQWGQYTLDAQPLGCE